MGLMIDPLATQKPIYTGPVRLEIKYWSDIDLAIYARDVEKRPNVVIPTEDDNSWMIKLILRKNARQFTEADVNPVKGITHEKIGMWISDDIETESFHGLTTEQKDIMLKAFEKAQRVIDSYYTTKMSQQ